MTAPPTSRHSYHNHNHSTNQHDQRLASNSSAAAAEPAAAQTSSHSRHSNRNHQHHHHQNYSASCSSAQQQQQPRSKSRSRSRSSRKTHSSNIEADSRKHHHSNSTDNSDSYMPREKEERHCGKKASIDSSAASRIIELQDPIFNENDDDIPLPPADEEENSSNEIDSEVDHNQQKNYFSPSTSREDKTDRNNKQQRIDSQSEIENNNLNFLPIQPDSDYSETSEMIFSEAYDLEGESAEDDQSNLKGANKPRVANSDSESTLEKLINLDTRNLTKRQRYIFQTMPTRILLRKHLAKEAVWGEDKLSNYKIIDKIGHGTYGLVYKAVRLNDQCDYALKKVKCENEKEGFPIFVIREIKILHQLNHPNIVGLKDVIIDRSIANDNNNNNNSGSGGGKEMAVFYLVFEYMQHDLMGFLEYCKKSQNNQKLEVDQICSLMMQLISGVAHCHQQGFMHRDIKCSNILLNEKGQIKLADFGLSRPYQKLMVMSDNGNNNSNKIGEGNSKTSESNSKTIRGTKYPIETTRPYTNKVITLWYRPPELLLGAEHYTPAVDVWSLGCILGEMFMLNPVFREPTELDMLDNIFRLCGTPNAENWPDVVKMPTFSAVSRWKQHRRILCEIYEDKIEMMPLDLLDKMLTLDPKCRISSIEAMQHPWIFSLDASQVKPLNLPNNRNLNEMSCKNERKQSSLSAHISNANRQSKS